MTDLVSRSIIKDNAIILYRIFRVVPADAARINLFKITEPVVLLHILLIRRFPAQVRRSGKLSAGLGGGARGLGGGLFRQGVFLADCAADAVCLLIDILGLHRFIRRLCAECSGGQQAQQQDRRQRQRGHSLPKNSTLHPLHPPEIFILRSDSIITDG